MYEIDKESLGLFYHIPVFFGITFLVFSIERLAGDPVKLLTAGQTRVTEQERQLLRQYFGLDKPLYAQYFLWLSELSTGNLGDAYTTGGGAPVSTLIGQRAVATLELQLLGLVFSLLIAIPIGVMSAKKRYSKMDLAITNTALIGTSIPIFFLGIIVILVFSAKTGGLLPYGGLQSISPSQYPFGNAIVDQLWHLVLPTSVYTFAILAPVVLLVRSSMLEVLRQDYILAAKASGLSDRTVTYKHGLRNALLPVTTYVGLYFGGLLTGAPITETVFNWPGVGRLFVDSINTLTVPVIQGVVVIITLMTLVANVITDISYAFIDPRIRID